MECVKNAVLSKETLGEKDKKIYKHLRSSFDIYEKDALVRLLATGTGKGVGEWQSWAENILGSALKDATVEDAIWVDSQTRKLLESTKNPVLKDGASLRELAIKAATLPADLFNYHGLGRIHERISEADQIRSERKASLEGKIKVLEGHMQSLVGLSIKESDAVFRKANKGVEEATAKYNLTRDAGKPAEREAARLELEQAKNRFEEQTGNRESASNSARIIRLVAERLNGDLTNAQLVAKIGKGAEYGDVAKVVATAKSLTKEFSDLLESSSLKLRDMLAYELEGKMSKEEALETASRITNFEKIEEYYPNKNLLALFQRVDGIINAKKIIAEETGDSFIEKINELISTQRTAHTKQRTGGSRFKDYNVLNVLRVYGREVYDHAHAAEIGSIATRFERKLMNLDVIRNAAGNPKSPEVLYANSVKRLLMGHMNQIFDKKASTFADESLATISAFQVFSKLTNPSTTLNNRVEGVLQYVAYHGGPARVARLRQLHKQYKDIILEAQAKAHTDFSTQELTDISMNAANNAALRKILSEGDLADAAELHEMRATGAMGQMRSFMSKLGGKGLGLVQWSRAENANRKEAFELSAAEAAHFVQGKWRNRFSQGKFTDFLVEHYDLNLDLVAKARSTKDSPERSEARSKLFSEFQSNYIIRQGMRGVFQTQFQYSESARNFMDLNPKTSWITMFQHYPRSLASTVLWAMHDVKSLYKTGGLSALKGDISKRKYGDDRTGRIGQLREKTAINHRLNHVLTLGGISVLREAVRMMTGFAAFNVLQHPLKEIMEDLYAYFADDEPRSKENKAWEMLYGRNQPVRRFTGPLVGTVLDATSIPASKFLQSMDGVGMALIEAGVRDGSMVQYLSDALGTTGLRPNQRALTDNGRKDYNSALEAATDYALHSFAIYGKGQAWVNAAISRNPYDFALQTFRMAGIRPDWKIINQAKDDKMAEDAREYTP